MIQRMTDSVIEHRTTDELKAGLDHIRAAPCDGGTVELVVARTGYATRSVLDEATLHVERGLVGDHWSERPSRTGPNGGPDPEKQLNIMSARAIAVIAGDRANWAPAGDQLYLDLDLSHENLPVGTRLRLGEAVIEITEPPHTGCAKFRARYGADAMRWVNSEEARQLRARGLCARVVTSGTVRTGDPATKLA